ncbi:VWA domain-containing protein [Terasakiella sp. A23]|uniref:VWA domain-containing protein n=1 Tax=Terasakiella sp. FCG-A23 TaxID=3080561 RepID=UPI002954E872|nr:VWA domain-containing protein [Terasakiella sp. A23]MDV7340380.1 VWA domain-containing protein [Terasakiella sp. A23]
MRPVSNLTKITELWRSLITDTRGTASILVAAGMVALVGFSGIATDTARAYLVKSRLSTALDAAGLAGGWSFFLDTRNNDVDMFFNANYPTGYMGSTLNGPTLVVDEENEKLSLQATASVPTLFMRVFGKDSIDVYAFAEITREMQALDAVIAMDMSGSMTNSAGSESRISAARNAATSLIDILFGDNTEKDLLNIGVVPWNGKVNVTLDGTTFDAAETVENDVDSFTNPVSGLSQAKTYTVNNSPIPLLWSPPENWKGCVYSRFIDDDDNDTNGDILETPYESVWVDWPAWEHIGPGSEPASSSGSDITIIQSNSGANKSSNITLTWNQPPKATNILIAVGSRASGSQFNTPSGWTSLANFTANDGSVDRYTRVFAKVAAHNETEVNISSSTTAHQGLTIFEVANIDWNDLVDDIRYSDHAEHNRDYVSLNSVNDLYNTGNLLIAVAGLADDDFSGFSWSNSFTPLDAVQQSGDDGEDLTHAVAYRKVSNTYDYGTTLSTTSGGTEPTWGLIIALEDRNICSASTTGGECTPCLSHGITPLTNVKSNVQSAINALQSPQGTTNITQGLGWAWRVLTPQSPFTEAVADPDYNRQQAIVLLTDGENYGGTGDGYKTVFGSGTGAGDEMDQRLLAIANNIKSNGVVLYVIQFANNGTDLQTLLQQVASGPDSPYYHYAPDAVALQDVFREVANHLSQLRLSK